MPLPQNDAISAGLRKHLYISLPHKGLKELLAFGVLYRGSQDGSAALCEAWRELFHGASPSKRQLDELLSAADDLISMSGACSESSVEYGDIALRVIEGAAKELKNRRLKGFYAKSLEEVLALAPEEIDLGRALLLAEMEGEEDVVKALRSYEASLDWMALQILAELGGGASDEEKITAINRHLFQGMHYRFPSYRKYAKQIDNYSLLGKVIEARQGVCLGVSLLFGCIAQRLGLPIVFITPPGHIFVRYEKEGFYRNIETTAGGIHVEDERYLGIEHEALTRRDHREVIGMVHLNAGSTFWHMGEYEKALEQYAKARRFMGEDPLLLCLSGFCSYLKGDADAGKKFLVRSMNQDRPLMAQPRSIAEDLLSGSADVESLREIYAEIDKKRPLLEEYRKKLEDVVRRSPGFRAGWLQLGMTWLELEREDKALEAFSKLHVLDASDVTVEYLLAELSYSREDYLEAWKYLLKVEELCLKRKKQPMPLKKLRTMLSASCAYEGSDS